MQGKYFLIIFCAIFLLVAPAAANLNKIAAGSPLFIGESDVDISSALNGCHTIAWWPNGMSTTGSPVKNVTIYEANSVSDKIYHFNVSPSVFSGYSGTWYCEDNSPRFAVFDLRDPQVSIKVWDLDHDQDVTGKTIPRATNITYRIDTDLYPALAYLNRPNSNPTDSFFTVRLTDPLNRNIANIYTGSYGGAQTLILPFDSNPFVSSSPYIWKSGNTWDRGARNIQGDVIYPPGTYTFTVSQNLNNMQQSYAAGGTNGADGVTTSTAKVTFLASEPMVVSTTRGPVVSVSPEVTISVPATPTPTTAATIATSAPVAKKTTYSPLPGWIAVLGVGICGFILVVRRNN